MSGRNEYEWDNDNEDKLATKHGVDRYEAEEAAEDPDALIKRVGIGKTLDGRILFMVVDKKGSRRFRIGSARDADFGQKRSYRRGSRKRNERAHQGHRKSYGYTDEP